MTRVRTREISLWTLLASVDLIVIALAAGLTAFAAYGWVAGLVVSAGIGAVFYGINQAVAALVCKAFETKVPQRYFSQEP